MGLRNTEFFESTQYEQKNAQVFVCRACLAHLCLLLLVISDNFKGLALLAYLVDKVINVQPDGVDQETRMLTGIYVINKVHCLQCRTYLGWTYKKLYDYNEQYKEGKYVIERNFIREIHNHSSTAKLLRQARRRLLAALREELKRNLCVLALDDPDESLYVDA